MWVSMCCSGNLRWLTSRLRDVTGEAVLEHGAVCCWFRNVTALARSWTLQMVGFSRCQGENSADWLPGRPCAESDEGEKQEQESKSKREGATQTRLVFLTVRFWTRPQAAGHIRVSVWGGAPPMSMVSGAMLTSSDISFIP